MGHITQLQRYTITCMLSQGYNQSKIAETIDKDKSVISREIKRNSEGRSGEYRHDLAHRKYEYRQK